MSNRYNFFKEQQFNINKELQVNMINTTPTSVQKVSTAFEFFTLVKSGKITLNKQV